MKLVLLQDIILNDEIPSKSVLLKSNLSCNIYPFAADRSKIQYVMLAMTFPIQIQAPIKFLPTFPCHAELQVMANNLARVCFSPSHGHFFYINLMLVTVKDLKY